MKKKKKEKKKQMVPLKLSIFSSLKMYWSPIKNTSKQ